MIKFFLAEALEKLGYANLKYFNDTSGVIEYFETTNDKPFLILCDINMPGQSGLSLRKEINENDYVRRKSIPFVFLSTNASKSQVAEAYEQHGLGILSERTKLKGDS